MFRNGGGIGWGELSPRISGCTCSSTSATYSAALIPSLPTEIKARLKAGATIADVGCGQGAAACMLGEAYPDAVVHGCDSHAPSVEAAMSTAQQRGLRNVSFAVGSGDAFARDASFDLVCFLDCFHDMAVATAAARHAHRALTSDGMLFLVEPMAAAHDSVSE